MANAVFTTKVTPSYDDLPEARYHFPRTYLRQVEAAAGDWIVYYEPRRATADLISRGGRQVYFAIARMTSVRPDPNDSDQFYADIDPSTYLEFDNPVAFKEGIRYFESALEKDNGSTNRGAFGRAVRTIPSHEFLAIVEAGFSRTLVEESLPLSVPRAPSFGIVAEGQTPFERPVIERLVSRPFRDVAFRITIKSAYNETCAVTGLKIVNGGGRTEAQAAHIRPVASGGSDSVRNGIALCSTMHWMFDRGLISLGDDYSILVAENQVPDAALRLIRPERKIIVPEREETRPHNNYLRFHRENVFKG